MSRQPGNRRADDAARAPSLPSRKGDVFCARNPKSAASTNRGFALEPLAHACGRLHHSSQMARMARIIVPVGGPPLSQPLMALGRTNCRSDEIFRAVDDIGCVAEI